VMQELARDSCARHIVRTIDERTIVKRGKMTVILGTFCMAHDDEASGRNYVIECVN